jgi:hypothetical protein
MPAADFPSLIARHRNYFLSGKTRPTEWREAYPPYSEHERLRGLLARLT